VKMAVSSAKVLRIVVLDCGISAVYIVYNNGPRMLLGGHPRALGMEVKFRCCMLSRIIYFVSIILGD
jgi:hypothetical protein